MKITLLILGFFVMVLGVVFVITGTKRRKLSTLILGFITMFLVFLGLMRLL